MSKWIVIAASLIASTTLAQRGRWPHVEPEAAAHTRRIGELAAAARITPEQATTVFRQILRPPHAPRVHSVVDEVRPDGTRNVFGLMDADGVTECVIGIGLTARECRERPHGRDVNVYVFFTQIDPAGRVVRTAFDLPFGVEATETQLMRPAMLRLFAPAPGAAKIAVIDGTSGSPRPVRNDRGEVDPAEYQHDVYVWNGRDGESHAVSALIQPMAWRSAFRVGTVGIDEAANRLVVRSIDCEGDCRCTLPTNLEAEAAQIERLAHRGGACTPTERPLELPAGVRLIDDDLDARAPRLTRDQAAAARAAALARAASIAPAQADAIVARLTVLPISPRFTRSASHVGADGARHVYTLVERAEFEDCVYTRELSTYDAVRACAGERETYHGVLFAAISPQGQVTGAEWYGIGTHRPDALHLLQDEQGIFAAVEVFTIRPGQRGRSASHELTYLRNGRHGGLDFVTRVIEARDGRHPDEGHVGELLVRPARGPLVTLAIRRAPCMMRCLCEPLPTNAAEERAIVARAATNGDDLCRPRDMPPRGR